MVGAGAEEEVDEARAGDLDLLDMAVTGERVNQLLRDIARFCTRRFGQCHGQVAGEVAMGPVTGTLEHDLRREVGRQFPQARPLPGIGDQVVLDDLGQAGAQLTVEVTNTGDREVEALLGLEWSLNMLGGGGNPSAWYKVNGETGGFDQRKTVESTDHVGMGNDYIGVELESVGTDQICVAVPVVPSWVTR